MSRIYVTAPPDDLVAGYFDEGTAQFWKGATYWDGNNNADKNTHDSTRSQGLYHTKEGRWVLHGWSRWQGEQPTYEYTTPTAAFAWLLFNDYDKDATKYFVEPESETGPNLGGRPEIGGPVLVRLGDTLPKLDAYAEAHDMTRAAAARELLDKALGAQS
ncbi:MAG TPA: hypothetical protein VK735_18565 [Pseudonocardia sp.]|uniref:hypothetical protein n=1 Tax=Pseudonocardia sp. TaxID=60912 RepID=UPI002CB3C2A9|nr:hypothetical protein [Pseudonocardia sp.]HTF49450.1 hypothetical protein [Pseudonocardia sp.]